MTVTHNNLPEAVEFLIQQIGQLKHELSKVQSKKEEDVLLNSAEAAELLKCETSIAYHKNIPFDRLFGKKVIMKSKLLEWREAQIVKVEKKAELQFTRGKKKAA